MSRAVMGPTTLQPAAHEIGDRLLALPDLLGLLGGRLDVRIEPAFGIDGLDQRQAFGADPEDVRRGVQARGAPRVDELVEVAASSRALAPSCSVMTPMACMASCSSSAFVTSGHACSRTVGDGGGIELADVGRALRIEPAALRDRERAPLFERRVVQIGVGPRGEDFRGERRRLDADPSRSP